MQTPPNPTGDISVYEAWMSNKNNWSRAKQPTYILSGVETIIFISEASFILTEALIYYYKCEISDSYDTDTVCINWPERVVMNDDLLGDDQYRRLPSNLFLNNWVCKMRTALTHGWSPKTGLRGEYCKNMTRKQCREQMLGRWSYCRCMFTVML